MRLKPKDFDGGGCCTTTTTGLKWPLLLLLLSSAAVAALGGDEEVQQQGDEEEYNLEDPTTFNGLGSEYMDDGGEGVVVTSEEEGDQGDFIPIDKKSQFGWSKSADDVFSRYSRFSANELVKRRLCIPPTMSCNLRPNSCCDNTTCRCNLWGQNCRCLRMGLFQRWGR